MNFLKVINDSIIKDYEGYSAVNYSLLKEIASGNYEAIRDGIPKRTSIYMDFGSYIDNVLTGHGPPADMYFYNFKEPTGHTKDLLNALKIRDMLNCTVNERLEVANELKLWSTTKKESLRFANCDTELINQYIAREKARIAKYNIMHEAEWALATKMINVLKTHEYSKDIISPPLKIQNITQIGLKFELEGVECKALLDFLQVNVKERWVQPIDLKTGSLHDFIKNLINYKYYLQGAFYTLAVINLVKTYPELKYFKVKPFKFLYLSKENPNLPLKYNLEPKDVYRYTEGYKNNYGNYQKGIVDLLKDYKFHKETGIYDRSREIHEANGEITIPSLS